MIFKTYFRLSCKVDVPLIVNCISVNIDGIIDLGKKWSYQYAINPAVDNHSAVKRYTLRPNKYEKITKNPLRIEYTPHMLVTQYSPTKATESIFETPRVVKEDIKLHDFTYHVYKQSLNVFDVMKNKVDPSIEDKIEFLARNYDVKFREFVNETLKKNIKTRLGSQRVVLNVIDTSNRLLKRLVNYFVGDMNREGKLRSNMAAANVFQKEVDRECLIEYQHACTKFGICRTSNGFSEFMIYVFAIIIKSSDDKIKQSADALTEVLKNTDFKNIMDKKTKKKFNKWINKMEGYEARILRAMFAIGKNVLALKNQPINVMVTGNKHITKTVALLEIINELDNILPSNEENTNKWDDIKESLVDWSDGRRHDILEIMQELINFLKNYGIDKLDNETASRFNEKLDLIFS